jgi:eukaryotic-like serine/threonine-protein kinase
MALHSSDRVSNRGRESCPSTQQLAACLEPTVADTAVASDPKLLTHIAVCTDCQNRLERLAVEEGEREEISRCLQAPDFESFRHTPTSHIVASICPLSAEVPAAALQDPLREHEIDQLTHLLQPPSHPELLGRIGRYELEQLVGRGGMGLVFRAYDTELHRMVAVKTLAVHLVPIGSARERFVREGRAGASLVHPYIVPVYDVITDGPVPALVMQYIAGTTLQYWLEQHGPLPWRHAVQLCIQLLDGLALAHDRGLIHRDIKPGNVLLEADASRALLTDFGLVRTFDDATLTHSGMLAGTPDFMSPEQARGESLDARSDLFSFGSLMYTMLTGQAPFRAADPMAILNRICHQPYQPLKELASDLPNDLVRLVDRLLAKTAGRRPESAAGVRDRLHQLVTGPLPQSVQRSHRRKRWAAAGALALTVAVGVWAVAWFADKLSQPNAKEGAHTSSSSFFESTTASDPSSSVESAPASDYGSQHLTGGFIDLQRLDEQIQRVDSEVSQTLNSYASPSLDSILQQPSAFAPADLELDQLHRQIEQLHQELRQP